MGQMYVHCMLLTYICEVCRSNVLTYAMKYVGQVY